MATDFLDLSLLASLRLLFDTASLVLIWLVQLVIYPSFLYLQGVNFKQWHGLYTKRVTYVVLPIMLGQLMVYGWLCLVAASWDVLGNTLLIAGVWFITFFLAVPLHSALDTADNHLPLSARLVRVNWWRTGLWTLVWGVSTWEVLP
ncbi:MAG: hypothetical protein AAGA31_04195 [Bacteroidota bacterium]